MIFDYLSWPVKDYKMFFNTIEFSFWPRMQIHFSIAVDLKNIFTSYKKLWRIFFIISLFGFWLGFTFLFFLFLLRHLLRFCLVFLSLYLFEFALLLFLEKHIFLTQFHLEWLSWVRLF